jgi:chemotaxis response regulator CheB
MTIRVAGTTFENRQERLEFLQQFKPEDLTVTLERENENKFDTINEQI